MKIMKANIRSDIFWFVIGACILILGLACSSESKRAQNAVDLAGYSLALDECRAEGKDAGKYEVYESCAQKADLKYGHKDGGQ